MKRSRPATWILTSILLSAWPVFAQQGRLRPGLDSVCRLPDLLDQLVLLSRGFLGAGEQKLLVYRKQTLPDWVLLDGERLLQILLNLVINATIDGWLVKPASRRALARILAA